MTQTTITGTWTAQDGARVIIQHSELVGTQFLTIAQARAMIEALRRAADGAQTAQQAASN